jgi:peptidoglycan hydrolase CwlO-like protein
VASSLTSVPSRAAHRSGPRRLLVLLLLLVPLLASGVGSYSGPPRTFGDELSDAQAQAKALAAKIAAQKAQLATLQALEASLTNDIAQTKSDLAGVNADLSAVKAKVAATGAQVNAVRAAYNALVAQIDDLDAQLGRIAMAEMVKSDQLTERKGILAARLRAAYTAGNTSLLETVLSADSFADALTDVGYYIDIGDQDEALARQIQDDEAALATLGQTVTDTRAAADDLRAQTAVQKAKLDAKLADFKRAQAQLKVLQAETKRQLALQAQAFAKLKQNKIAAAAALAREAKAQRQVKAKIAQLIAAQFAGGNIPSVYNGSLAWPLKGIITQEFGCTGFPSEPPLGNCAHFHTAIDIAQPMYRRIPAACAGRRVRGSALRRRLGRHHRPQPIPRDAVRPCRQPPPSAGRPGRAARPRGPGHRLRRDDRQHDRAAPPLGGRAERQLGQSASVPLSRRPAPPRVTSRAPRSSRSSALAFTRRTSADARGSSIGLRWLRSGEPRVSRPVRRDRHGKGTCR